MKISIPAVCIYPVLTVAFGFGQSFQLSQMVSTGLTQGQYTITCTVAHSTMMSTMIVKGQPYSGEEVLQQVQNLADGNRVVQPGFSTIIYRDLSGRVRTERRHPRPIMSASDVADIPVVAEIIDPVSGYNYYLDPVNRTAYRIVLPQETLRFQPPPSKTVYPKTSTTGPGTNVTSEPLGTKMLEGVEVQGRRITTTYDVGARGNDKPVVTTIEVWTSEELGVTVYSKSSDPLRGDTISATININRSEPDAALFRIPDGYRIVDEQTVPFTFTISQ